MILYDVREVHKLQILQNCLQDMFYEIWCLRHDGGLLLDQRLSVMLFATPTLSLFHQIGLWRPCFRLTSHIRSDELMVELRDANVSNIARADHYLSLTCFRQAAAVYCIFLYL